MFFRPMLVCFWGQTEELNVVRREEDSYAEGRSRSALAEVAVADNRLKRLSICPVSNISAKTTALVEITHRTSCLRARRAESGGNKTCSGYITSNWVQGR